MNDEVKIYISDKTKLFNKYKKILKDKSVWTLSYGDEKKDAYKVEYQIINVVFSRLEYFSKTYKADLNTAQSKRFIKLALELIDIWRNRVNYYFDTNDFTEIEDKKKQLFEVSFQAEVQKNLEKINAGLRKLVLKTDDAKGIQFFDNKKATIPMHNILLMEFPELAEHKLLKKINFNGKPSDNKMLILMDKKKIPKYNPDKHYWEQDEKTLKFWVNEFNKIVHGITIDGVFIDPWMYFHLNFFKTKIPTLKNGEIKHIVKNPPLRDNEWFLLEAYKLAEKEKKMMMVAASRRVAKSTFVASRAHWKGLTRDNPELVFAGGNKKDLGQITKNINTSISYVTPAFYVNYNTSDWTKEMVSIGLKHKGNSRHITKSRFYIVNLEGGVTKESSEKLAGFTPEMFVIDELFKFSFKEALEAVKPAMQTEGGKMTTTALLLGTGGNEDLSKDGVAVLRNPKANNILEMDWNLLNKQVPKEYRTWREQTAGIFLPAQMSINYSYKKPIGLDEYLGLDYAPELSKIKIMVTDWKKAKEKIMQVRAEKKADKKALIKERVYYPIDPEEIFLSGKTNPFKPQAVQKHIDYLLSTGNYGKKVELYTDKKGNVKYNLSDKPVAEFPFDGGFIDAPVILYEELPETQPPDNQYVAGLDDYKQEQADSDSVGSFHIYKRNTILGVNNDKIVASLATRPDPHRRFHQQMHLLIRAFNVKVFMENEDMSFKDYLDRYYLTEQVLVPSIGIAQSYNLNFTERRQFGWTPTPRNKSHVIGRVISYAEEIIKVVDEDGIEREVMGLQRINDLGLLYEMLNYKEGGNYDRITSFGSALVYDDYLTKLRISPTERKKRKLYSDNRRAIISKKSPYATRRHNPF